MGIDSARCERLIDEGLAGDASARNDLVEQLWPFWLNRVRARKALRALPRSDDHVHNVVSRLVAKLLDEKVLASYKSWKTEHPELDFAQWIHRVTDNEVHEYMRNVAGRSERPPDDSEGPSAKLLLNEFATSSLWEDKGIRPPNTAVQTAREIVRFAEQHLPEQQLQALTQWIQGATDVEIAEVLLLTPEQARDLRRSAVARLRRAFGGEED